MIKEAEVVFSLNPPVKDFDKMKNKMVVSWVGRLLPTGKEAVAEAVKHGVQLVDTT